MMNLPILATIPRSGTWFLRLVVSFLCCLDGGGAVADRLTGEIHGNRSGKRFDIRQMHGGPLFGVGASLPVEHLFIGHAVCPGFSAVAHKVDWWARGDFHAPGFDYFHAGLNYAYTPVDFDAGRRYLPVDVAALDAAPWADRDHRTALVYRNPIDQAESHYHFLGAHIDPAMRSFQGQPLGEVGFRRFLFEAALPAYARQFISFQRMAAERPGQVALVAYEHLTANPERVMPELLNHLGALGDNSRRTWPLLPQAIHLARKEHVRALEKELGHSLDGERPGDSHLRRNGAPELAEQLGPGLRNEALDYLASMGVDTGRIAFAA